MLEISAEEALQRLRDGNERFLVGEVRALGARRETPPLPQDGPLSLMQIK